MFTSNKLENGDYVLIKVESINLSLVRQDKVDDDNYLDYLEILNLSQTITVSIFLNMILMKLTSIMII